MTAVIELYLKDIFILARTIELPKGGHTHRWEIIKNKCEEIKKAHRREDAVFVVVYQSKMNDVIEKPTKKMVFVHKDNSGFQWLNT
jgi:hypothetical protein